MVFLFISLGEAHSLQEIRTLHHMLSKSVAWMKKYWKSYDGICTLPEFTTAKPGIETTTEKQIVSSASTHEYFNAFVVLLAMQCFTLGVWVQLK